MVANAHIDPVWIWDWHEGMHEVLATFRAALDRLEEDRDLVFSASSSAFYEWVEQVDPAMFTRIRQAVESGNWTLVGGQWVEPDCNIPSGESVCRQFLYGQRYLVSRFGFGASIGWNVDAFGHAASLPQILIKAGLRAYVMMRPDEKEKRISSPLFEWVGSDGTAITTYRVPFSYATDPFGEEEMLRDRTSKLLQNSAELGIPLMCLFGVGNHGGGPTRAALRTIKEICETTDGKVSLGGPSTYFAHIGDKPRPDVRGDLQWHAVGCYSARAATKRANCQSEQALVVAEKMETLSRIMTGRRLGIGEQLGRGWRSLLFSQFHDSLGGTCTNFSTEGVDLLVSEARVVADRVGTLAIHALAQLIDTWTEGAENAEGLEASVLGGLPIPLIVCNPLSWPTTLTVTVPYPVATCTDATGTHHEVQHVASGEATYSPSRTLLQLPLPAFGYRRFWLHAAGRDCDPAVDDRVPVAAQSQGSLYTIENDCLELAIDSTTGLVRRLLDKRTMRQWIGSQGVRAVVIEDASDTWSHGIERYDAEERRWQCESVEITERGPIRATVRSRFVFESSTLTQEISLYRGRPFAEINVDLDWHERHRLLKLVIPLALADPVCAAGAPYGYAERTVTGHEEPMVHWVDVSERGGRGLTCTSDGTYAYDVLGGVLRLTLVRSPRVADHGRGWGADDPIGYPFLDQGAHRFSIRLHPHEGTWHDRAVRQAEEHLVTPPVVLDTWHPGPLPPSGSALEVTEGSVIVTAAKRAESAPGTVVRVLEVSGRPTNVALTLKGRPERWESHMSADEGVFCLRSRRHHRPGPCYRPLRAGARYSMTQVDELFLRYPILMPQRESLEDAFEILARCLRAGSTVYVCGNGGSAADAEHIVGELMKGISRRRPISLSERERLLAAVPGFEEETAYLADRLDGALRAVCLSSQTSLLTAVANDLGPDVVFAQPVFGYGRAGDVLWAISTSGRSRNVILATIAARARSMAVIALTGEEGLPLGSLADAWIRVPARDTSSAQELHVPVYHALCRALEESCFPEGEG